MHASFQKRFERLQHLLEEYEKTLSGLPTDQLNKKPATGGWTINQIVHHIAGAEAGIIQAIKKKLIDPGESKPAGIRSFYRATLLRYALRSKRKFKAPKVLAEPTGSYEKNELLADWRKTRKELEELCNSIERPYINHQLFRHPVVGKINLKQTLGFMGDHMQRHLEQIQQIKSTL
jgi:hypothetical protein